MAVVPEFQITHDAPKLWVERVVLFESIEPPTPIREIPLTRGLNVIWGEELPDDVSETSPVVLSGHSVGKTTLCRLIRYLLGEKHFGAKGSESRIKRRYPHGYVFADIHIEGTKWTVLKPLAAGNSKAKRDSSIEDLLELESKDNDYRAYSEALREFSMAPLAARHAPGSARSFEWLHLLGWLARDQEARFQNLWEWRSVRSHTESPALQRPKEDALYLVRAVLDLLNDREIELAQEVDELAKDIRQTEERVTNLKEEPAANLRRTEFVLEEFLTPGSRPTGESDELFSFPNQATAALDGLRSTAQQLQSEVDSLNADIAERQALLAWYEEQQRGYKAGIDSVEETTEPPRAESEDEDLQKLRGLLARKCLHGNVPYQDCDHYKENLRKKEDAKVVEFERERQDRRADEAAEQRKAEAERLKKEYEELQALLTRVRTGLREARTQKYAKDIELARLRAQIERMDNAIGEYTHALDLAEGRTPNTALNSESTKLDRLRSELETKTADLEHAQNDYEERIGRVTETYNALLKHVLSTTYSGEFRMKAGEPAFFISETDGMLGEAVETLALILADVACVLCSMGGQGFHPRFLIHDSPREADLDRHVYRRFLHAIAELSEELGGAQSAPFQYIVTTTTRPPDSIVDNGLIRLRLAAHPEEEMLFGCRLVNLGTSDLFVGEGKEND